jgi:hypothetical protein
MTLKYAAQDGADRRGCAESCRRVGDSQHLRLQRRRGATSRRSGISGWPRAMSLVPPPVPPPRSYRGAPGRPPSTTPRDRVSGPPRRECSAGIEHGLGVRVQISARDGRILVARHALQQVELDASVCPPGERSLPQPVAYEARQTELLDEAIPAGSVPEARGGDDPTPRFLDQPFIALAAAAEALECRPHRDVSRSRWSQSRIPVALPGPPLCGGRRRRACVGRRRRTACV